MTDQTQTTKPRSGRVLRIALFVSLALNIVIVGLFAGAVFDNRDKIGRGGPNTRAAFDAGIGPFGNAMTREQRRDFGREFDGRRDDLRDNRGEVRSHMQAMISAIVAQPFDEVALRDAFTAAQYALGERQRIGGDVLMNRIAAMTDGERAEFAERLVKSLRGMDRRGG